MSSLMNHEASESTSNVNAYERCQYPNKVCTQPRTTKRDGGLHRFCAIHRDKANRNQKRWLESRQHKLNKTRRVREAKTEHTTGKEPLEPLTTLDFEQLEIDFELLFTGNLAALESTGSIFDGVHDLSEVDDDALLDFIDQFFDT